MSPLNRTWIFFLSVLLFSLPQANEQAEGNEPDDRIPVEWEREPGHWLGNAGKGTSLTLTATTAMQNRKKNPWNETCGVSSAAEGDKPAPQPRGSQELSWASISARFWWDTSTCCSGALQGSCAWVSPQFQWVLSRWSCFSPTGTKGRWNPTLPCPLQAFVAFQSHQNKGAVVPLLGSP